MQQRELDAQTQQQVEDLLSNAEAAGGQECQSIVMEARQQLDSAQSQQSPQVVRTAPESAQQPAAEQSQAGQQQRQAAQGPEGTEVEVQQQPADVDVQTPAPQVTVEQRQPRVTVRQPEPEVTVQQAEPEVSVQQAEPQVEVSQAEPQVEVEQAEGADVRVVQPEDQQQSARTEAESQPELEYQAGGEITESDVSQLVGQTVQTRDGEDVGEITGVARSLADQQLHALVDVGGFLGIGERTVSIPLERAQLDQDGNVMTQMSRQEIEQMQEYDPTQYASIEEGEDQRILR
ncbi:MAG: PRC-barrel domain-containing protein [Gammaproteobacteria bacterium]|nr:PRC-barrel domain-containing protein [Gammaproteobacteria bacterium]